MLVIFITFLSKYIFIKTKMTSKVHEKLECEAKKRKLLESEQHPTKRVQVYTEQTCNSESPFKLIPILADKYSRPIETEKMFVGKINSKKETSRLIRELSAVWPLEGRSHLKRVRWTSQKDIFEILIRPLNENEDASNPESCLLNRVLGETNINSTGLMDTFAVYDVSKYPALTHQQNKDFSELWPLQFREDKNIEKVLKDELFSSEERENISKFMKMSLGVARHGDHKVGCVIVDPADSKVIAVAHDQRLGHPLQHAVMVAVDLVAKSQGGGCWDTASEHLYYLPYSKDNYEDKIEELKRLNPGKDVKKMALPYLCTSYDAYISREPCVMCAMALVHSRIRRVFYSSPTSWGALGSHCKLHILEGLNHHYEVFRFESQDIDNSQIQLENCSKKS